MKFSVSPTTPVTHAVNFGCVVVDLESPLSTDPVTLSIGTNPTVGSVLSGVLTVNAVDGVAVFGPLQISLAGVGYTLVATAPQQHYGITGFAPVGQFQPGVASAAGEAFQPGYYYNYPPSGDGPTDVHNTVTDGAIHGNIPNVPPTVSVTSAPFNVV